MLEKNLEEVLISHAKRTYKLHLFNHIINKIEYLKLKYKKYLQNNVYFYY